MGINGRSTWRSKCSRAINFLFLLLHLKNVIKKGAKILNSLVQTWQEGGLPSTLRLRRHDITIKSIEKCSGRTVKVYFVHHEFSLETATWSTLYCFLVAKATTGGCSKRVSRFDPFWSSPFWQNNEAIFKVWRVLLSFYKHLHKVVEYSIKCLIHAFMVFED